MKKYLREGTCLTYHRGIVEELPVRSGISRNAFLSTLRSQIGRSMVEMLAVLAIIGVLSIGGIAGYSFALNKNHSNTLLAEVSRIALDINIQKSLGVPLDRVQLPDLNSPFRNVQFRDDLVLFEDPDSFGIQVANLDKGVCKALIGMNGDTMGIAKVDDNELSVLTAENCMENNTIAFVFGDAAYAYRANGNQGEGGSSTESDEDDSPDSTSCADICTTGFCDNENCVACPDDCISCIDGQCYKKTCQDLNNTYFTDCAAAAGTNFCVFQTTALNGDACYATEPCANHCGAHGQCANGTCQACSQYCGQLCVEGKCETCPGTCATCENGECIPPASCIRGSYFEGGYCADNGFTYPCTQYCGAAGECTLGYCNVCTYYCATGLCTGVAGMDWSGDSIGCTACPGTCATCENGECIPPAAASSCGTMGYLNWSDCANSATPSQYCQGTTASAANGDACYVMADCYSYCSNYNCSNGSCGAAAASSSCGDINYLTWSDCIASAGTAYYCAYTASAPNGDACYILADL